MWTSRAPGRALWIRFLSGPDIDALGLTGAEITAAVHDAVLAHGEGRVVFEPRVHLSPATAGPVISTCFAATCPGSARAG